MNYTEHGDLSALREQLLLPVNQRIFSESHRRASSTLDYAYRMVVPRSILAAFMASLMEELDYGNFKATLPSSDRLRHDAYYKCWKVMDEWQGKMRK
jgi:hypothetical protein